MVANHYGWLSVAALALALFAVVEPAIAQAPTPKNSRDEAAITRAAKDYLAALDRGDAKAIAEFWTREGTYEDENGQTFNARELIASASAAKGQSRPRNTIQNQTVRFLAADVAIEQGDCEISSASMPIKGRFSAIWVRQNDKWKLDSLRETRTATLPNSDHLASLEPLVGDWAGQAGNLNLRVSAKWNPEKTFLCRELTSLENGKASLSGTQQIGWDPISQQIKSWVFNSDGSRSEGVWSLEGNVWMVLATGVLPDGKPSKATHIFKFKDKDTLVFKSTNGSLDGQSIPDRELTLTRQRSPK